MIATRAVRLGACSMLAVAWTSTAFAWGPQAKLAYSPLDDAPKIIPRGYRLGESYLVRAEPILKKQMARASVRLANELNAIFK